MRMCCKKNDRGFTLIELMIVVAVVGILAALAIPNFLRFQAKSKQTEAQVNLRSIYASQNTYFAEHDTYTAAITNLEWEPEGTARYQYTIMDNADTAHYTAQASGNIDNDATRDVWSITKACVLDNTTNDVTTP